MRRVFLALLLLALPCLASALTMDAGGDQTLVLPQTDLTLFGHTDSDVGASTITWTQLTGPISATMSASWALANTLTLPTAGTYTFRLTVSDGTTTATDDMTATVTATATAFYVDPTYSGGSNDGSTARPWTSLAVARGSAVWTAINSALATGHVVVYFSARTASADTAEVEHSEINLWRTDTSTHRLLLDGMSQYNTNDVTPAWTTYTGTQRFTLAITSGSLSIGVQSDQTAFPMHTTTLRGFDVSGCSGRVLLAGNNVVAEYLHVHDVTCEGATVQVQAAVEPYPGCAQEFGNLHDITLRNNVIERGQGEAIYVSGNYIRTGDGGCPSWGNTHSDILIERNTIRDPATNGGQGDGIDLKAGLMRVTVRGNTISHNMNSADGLVSLGVFPPARTDYLIEHNIFAFPVVNGMSLGHQNGTIIRNNLIYPAASTGIYLTGDGTTADVFNVSIYNNTIYLTSGTGIGIGGTTGAKIRNNLIFGLCGACKVFDTYNSTGIDSDYNTLSVGASVPGYWPGPETHSATLTSNSGIVVDTANANFHVVSGSPAINGGVTLSATGFANDADSVTRPQGAAWDIGAYEYVNTLPPVPHFRVHRR